MSSCCPRRASLAPTSAASATAAAAATCTRAPTWRRRRWITTDSGHRLERRLAQRLRERAHLRLVRPAGSAALEMGGDHHALELRQLAVQTDGDLPTNPFTYERPNRSHVHSDEPERRELAVNSARGHFAGHGRHLRPLRELERTHDLGEVAGDGLSRAPVRHERRLFLRADLLGLPAARPEAAA